MTTVLFSLGDVARMLAVKPHKLHYLISTAAVAEPQLRVAGKRLWNPTEVAALAETLETQMAAKAERQRRTNG